MHKSGSELPSALSICIHPRGIRVGNVSIYNINCMSMHIHRLHDIAANLGHNKICGNKSYFQQKWKGIQTCWSYVTLASMYFTRSHMDIYQASKVQKDSKQNREH